MAQVFYRKKFSYYLGEQRPLNDIVVQYTSLIPPTPTSTPVLTNTPTPTQTSTPTNTPTNTVTPTNTSTPTTTPTNTVTPTITPTNNAICPEQIIVSDWTGGGTNFNGTYNRLWEASGSTMIYGFTDGTLIGATGTAGDGFNYPVYKEISSNKFLCRRVAGSSDELWRFISTNPNPWGLSGATSIVSTLGASPTITQGSVRWPQGGNWTIGSNTAYVSYPATCPTPTPTQTPTQTTTPTTTPTPSASPSPAFDADAASFLGDVLLAGGALDATISGATNTLFTDLKSNGLYTKLRAFYPLVGATSGSTSIMGKRVSGTTYDISWTNVGSITFDYSGVTGDGSTTFGDTNFNFSTEVSSDVGAPSHFSIYLGTDTDGNQGEIGCRGVVGDAILIAVKFSGIYYGWQFTQGGSLEVVYSNPDAKGMYIQTRTSITSLKAFKNNVLENTVSLSDGKSSPNVTIKVLSDGSIYSDRRFQFVSIGEGLDDTEVGNLDTIINTFQTTLGRNTY